MLLHLLMMLSPPRPPVVRIGSRVKAVRCEACGDCFAYTVTRTAAGQDQSLLSWTRAASDRKAAADAVMKLDQLLTAGVETAPCPHCNWVQKEMVAAARRRHHQTLKDLTVFGFVAGAGVGIAFVLVLTARHLDGRLAADDPAEILKWAGVVGLVASPGFALWGLRRALNLAYDPNRDHPAAGRRIDGDPG